MLDAQKNSGNQTEIDVLIPASHKITLYHTVVAEIATEFILFEPEVCICNGN